MLVIDLQVGDIVKRSGDDHKYLVTSTRPSRGLKDYVCLMGPHGHFGDVWVMLIKENVGHIDMGDIFKALGNVDGTE